MPKDANETTDTDGDCIGNNTDEDDDNDGYVDLIDVLPTNQYEWMDSDGDGIGNNADTDDDNDGVEDSLYLFPLDRMEWTDFDLDGIGDNSDNDDDNDGIDYVNVSLPLDDDANFTDFTQAAFREAFGGTDIGEGLAYSRPAPAESWGGFANLNASLYPIKLTEAGTITFNASVPSGGDVDVRFRFEKNPHPDTEPSFNTDVVTVSGAETASYTINVPAQGANTFASFIMYLDTIDVPVVITDVVANVDAESGGGVDPTVGGIVTFSVDMTGVDLGGAVPFVEGSFNGYCGGCAPMSDDNNDGVW